MNKTLRPQNKCQSCGHTWYPRGKNVSAQCPNCKRTGVSRIKSGGILGIIGLVVFSYIYPTSTPSEKNKAENAKTTGAPRAVIEAARVDLPQDGVAAAESMAATALANTNNTAASDNDNARAQNREVSYAPSFACSKARTKTEHMICNDSELSRLDDELAKLYRDAMNVASEKVVLKQNQSQWITAERGKCFDVGCLRSTYEARIAFFRSTNNQPSP